MFKRLALRLVVTYLRDSSLTLEDRALLTTLILDKLKALPVSAILTTDDDGTLVLNGKRVNAELAIAINKSAARVLGERAFKVVLEQTRFAAVDIGIYQGLTPDQSVFAKAALWQIGETKKSLEWLAGGVPLDDDLDDDD